MRILVTGGAGFIGSHLTNALIAQGNEVVALDNLSSGLMKNLPPPQTQKNFKFLKADLKSFGDWNQALDGVSLVCHLAANPEVRVGEVDPSVHFQENLFATFRLLEAMRMSQTKNLLFASTSTVYGEPNELPTTEDYGPLLPISTYGASKLGCEVLLSSYAHTHGIRSVILRLGNCVGSRAQHGVVVDFIRKLKTKPSSLEVLGDGTQEKSYVHIDDCIDATLFLKDRLLRSQDPCNVYNVSSQDQISVKQIAQIVIDEMGIQDARIGYTGGVDGGRGWLGDVKKMHLSIRKLQALGWSPKLNSEAAIRKATRELLTGS
jgi:UDP-glucose 4-epimerase